MPKMIVLIFFGKHKIDIMNLYKCGDKRCLLEKTLTYIEKLKVESNIGVASKDSSEVFINNSQISQTDSCISVYNKKDEFDGEELVFQTLVV